MSVGEPIQDSALNRGGLLMFAGIAVLVIIVVAILIAVLHH
jgi:Na+-transporting methylmalonyl-CoA/oxaloacetate decarboxylase gamma subunit